LVASAKDIPFLDASNADNPPPEFYVMVTNVLAVRCDAGSNVTESIVERMKILNFMNAEGMFNKCVDRSISSEGPNKKPIRFKSLEDLAKKMTPESSFHTPYYTLGWFFQPMQGTNLWTAIELLELRPYGDTEHLEWGIDGGFKVHVFNEMRFISTKKLNPFSPPRCNGFAELRFDSTGRNLIYKTKDGYEVYDLLIGTVKPCDPPKSEWGVLALADFHFDSEFFRAFPEPHPEKFSQH